MAKYLVLGSGKSATLKACRCVERNAWRVAADAWANGLRGDDEEWAHAVRCHRERPGAWCMVVDSALSENALAADPAIVRFSPLMGEPVGDYDHGCP